MKRKFWPLFALLIAGFLLLSGCAGAPLRGWSGPVVAEDSLYVGTMEGKLVGYTLVSEPRLAAVEWWRFPPRGEPGLFAIYGTPFVEEGIVYIGAYSGKVYAIDGAAGIEIWEYPRDGFIGPIVGSPVVDGGTLYIGSSDGKLYALDVQGGQEIWPPFQAGGDIWGSVAISDGVVYFGSFDHKLYAIDAQTGAPVWDSPFETGGAIASTPFLHNGTIYFGSFDNNFYALNLDGTEKWRFEEAGNWFWGQAVAYNDIIIAGCLDHKIYALDAESGDEAWLPFETGGPIRGDPALVGELVIFGSDDGKVYALAAATGGERWHRTLEPPTQVRAPLFPGEGVVYVHAFNDTVYAFEMEYGNTIWSVTTSE